MTRLFIIRLASAASVALFSVMDANPALYFYDAYRRAVGGGRYANNNNNNNNRLSGTRVWITGASSGIGAQLAEEMYKSGAHVVISARRREKLKVIADRCTSTTLYDHSKGSVKVLPLDVTSSTKKLNESIKKVIALNGGIDLLVLNAGRTQRLLALDTNETLMSSLIELNFIAPVQLALNVIRLDSWNKKQTGHIIVTSSVAGKYGVAMSSTYAASKHALNGFFSSLRAENPWLRVDIVCPGPIATPIEEAAVSLSEHFGSMKNDQGSKMATSRCVNLMMHSIVGPRCLFYETWIAKQPVLAFSYLNQYFPGISFHIINILGNARVKAFQQGLDTYQIASLLRAAWICSNVDQN